MKVPQISGDLYAGEALTVAPCYIKASDGKVYQSNGTALNEAATFFGFTPAPARSGQPVTLYGIGARFRYGTGLTIGAKLFVSATAGASRHAATTGGTVAIARVITATDIQVIVTFTCGDLTHGTEDGTYDISSLLAAQNLSAVEFGIDTIAEVIAARQTELFSRPDHRRSPSRRDVARAPAHGRHSIGGDMMEVDESARVRRRRTCPATSSASRSEVPVPDRLDEAVGEERHAGRLRDQERGRAGRRSPPHAVRAAEGDLHADELHLRRLSSTTRRSR
jgi:hypothetical protein